MKHKDLSHPRVRGEMPAPLCTYITIANIKHLTIAYGISFHHEIIKQIIKRVAAIGIPHEMIKKIGTDTIMVETIKTGNHSHIEKTLRISSSFYKKPISVETVEIIPCIRTGIINRNNFELLSPSETGELFATQEEIAPPLRSDPWRIEYIKSMSEVVQFYKHNQPQNFRFMPVSFSKKPDTPLYHEMLPFWANPKGTNYIISKLEKTGTASELEKISIKNAINLISHAEPENISTNINPQNFHSTQDWEEVLESVWKLPHEKREKLFLSIAETSEIKHSSTNNEKNLLAELKEAGCTFVLNNFGKDSSGFRNLDFFSPDIIKIDATYMHNARADKNGKKKLESLVKFCKSTSIHCAVGGVETTSDLELAKDIGADLVQGYFLNSYSPKSI
ncbi:EAL domain-containing protein [Pseudomonas aeruginosa]|uniref:EAL domain-containing protein n=1 Tax=Pseudomonas aeruginosa TaxID=287 RepID=UPI00383B7AA6